ncbi:MAG: hypothetical protein NTZ17_02095 [Phycisphaerae bacterium]|nr:hypothetical protein [Phycisphaerae bacterium]
MNDEWISCELLTEQESETITQTEHVCGKNRDGWCDFATDGVDLLLQGIHHLRRTDDTLDERGGFRDFTVAMRSFAYYQFYCVTLTYKAVYNLIHQGYYTESAILLRSIVEGLVRVKYLHRKKDIGLLNTAWAGHYGYEGKRFRVKYEEMFEDIAHGSYKYYRLLCDMAHGSLATHLLKVREYDRAKRQILLDRGIVFKAEQMSFVLNQFSVYLLAHIVLMSRIYPEVEDGVPEEYATRYRRTLSKLWAMMGKFAQTENNQEWHAVMKELVTS